MKHYNTILIEQRTKKAYPNYLIFDIDRKQYNYGQCIAGHYKADLRMSIRDMKHIKVILAAHDYELNLDLQG